MTALIIILLTIIAIAFVIQRIAKFVLRRFYSGNNDNPYTNYHKKKMANDKHYDEYLEWTKNKEVYGVPVDKVEDVQEVKASKKVNRLVPRRKFTEDDKLF